MSLQAIAWAFEQDLPCAHKFTLIALANYSNVQECTCYPSQSRLAQDCGLSRSRVNTIIGDLEADGYITTSPRSRGNGSATSLLYQLLIPQIDFKQPSADLVGHIYVAATDQHVKIGITRDVDTRIKGLQTSNANTVRLIGSVETTMQVARRAERRAQDAVASSRLSGEWFDISPGEALSLIKNCIELENKPPNEIEKDEGVSSDKTGGVLQEDTGGLLPKQGVSSGKTPIEEPSLNQVREPSSNTTGSGEPDDGDEIVFQGKLLYLKRKQLWQFRKKYDYLPQADIIDFLQRLDEVWADGTMDKPPKNIAEAFMRAQKWLARKNREAFMRAKDQGGGGFVSDRELCTHAAGWAIQAAVDGDAVWAKFEADEPYRKLIAYVGKKQFVVEYIKPNWETATIQRITRTTLSDKLLTPEKGDAMLDELQKGLRLNKSEQLTRWWHKELVG